MSFITFTALAVFVYYLFGRAEITRLIWSRYPRWLDKLATCPACSGWWIGLALAPYLGAPWAPSARTWEVTLWSGVWGLLLTPIGFALLHFALGLTAVNPPGLTLDDNDITELNESLRDARTDDAVPPA